MLTHAHLYDMQVGLCRHAVPLSSADTDHVAGLHRSRLIADCSRSRAVHDSPHLVTVQVPVTSHAPARLHVQVLRHRLESVCRSEPVYHLLRSPAPLLVHRTVVHPFHIGLQLLAVALVRHEDAVGTGCHHQVLRPHAEAGDVQRVDDVCAVRRLVHLSVADDLTAQHLRQHVPCSQVLPQTLERYDGHRLRLLCHLVVEADLRQLAVAAARLVEGAGLQVSAYDVQHVSQAESEHAAIPQGALADQRACFRLVGLLREPLHAPHRVTVRAFRHDISVFRRGIERMDAHQHQVAAALCHGLRHPSYRPEIAGLRIGVARHHHHRLVLTATFLLLQIQAGQGNGGEGVAPFRFRDDVHRVSQLTEDRVALALPRGDGDARLQSGLAGLPHDALHHRFPRPVG